MAETAVPGRPATAKLNAPGRSMLASGVALTPRAARDLYADRWPVEQLPLAAKQLLGAERSFVSAPETCQRLPEVALLAGAILSYLAIGPVVAVISSA